MTKRKIGVSIFLYPAGSPVLALLLRDAFRTANGLLGEERFAVELVGTRKRMLKFDDVAVAVNRIPAACDLLFVAPVGRPDAMESLHDECAWIRRLHQSGAKIGAPCLGSLLLAQAGILDGRAATTHWAWLEHARARFPNVQWNTQSMICRDRELTTSGGYLATIDLALDFIARNASKKLALEVGRLLLAESTREKQSVYATQLALGGAAPTPFAKLETWLNSHLHREVTVVEMAEICRMSLRTFQRAFTAHYGIAPKTHLQLRRIEKAKKLLSETEVSLEEILERVGVRDLSSFRKVFRREIGFTPAEFRRRLR